MMTNKPGDCSPAAKRFFALMDIVNIDKLAEEKERSAERVIIWQGRKIVWHCAPILNEEEQRRLIGNDNAVLFFKDEGEPFNPLNVNDMGVMPQCFVVVQPYEDEYKVAFFKRKSINMEFGPDPMKGLIVSHIDIKDFVITKLHNASLACLLCPPLLNLIARPRAAAIAEVIEKHNAKGKLMTKGKI